MPYLFLILLSILSPLSLANPASAPAFTPPPPVISSGGILQMIASLLLVLGLIVLVAWGLKRVNLGQHGASQQLKVVASAAIGQRERIVLVVVADTCLVIGVGPNQIRTLHSFPKPDHLDVSTAAAQPQFAELLARFIKQKK